MIVLGPEDDPTLFNLTLEKYKIAFKIFGERTQRQDKRLMCELHDVFAGPESRNHNCLGCNFDEMVDQILKFLFVCQNTSGYFTTQQAFYIYALLLSVVLDRMDAVFKIISLPKDSRVLYFGAFIKARKWAIFFKHPKAFAWMVHHPEYTYENSPHSISFTSNPSYKKVNYDFVKKYYADNENSEGLTGEFSGHENKIVVVLPDIETLTLDICSCLEKFVEIVSKKEYREILEEKSTLVNYFSEQDKLVRS